MSFRNTFVTDFIYQASEETRSENDKIRAIFEKWCGSTLDSVVDKRGYGYYAGMFKGLYPKEYQNDLDQVIPKLEKATKIPFRLVILPECGPAIIYEIKPC